MNTSKFGTMASHTSSPGRESEPSATCLPSQMVPTIRITDTDDKEVFNHSDAFDDSEAFKDDLEQHPERHFLSPMTVDECYGWDSDSDDDDGEWNAGIKDFSLFTADRKRAMEAGEPLSEEWEGFVEGQADVFLRSVERVREDERDDVPALTPDTSPSLKDNLEEDEDEDKLDTHMPVMPQIQVPDYLTMEVTPSSQGLALGPDDELPLSFSFRPKSLTKLYPGRVQRPGLRHSRTLSGKRHVWRRPDEEMFTLGEDVIREEEAEREDVEESRTAASTGFLEMRSTCWA